MVLTTKAECKILKVKSNLEGVISPDIFSFTLLGKLVDWWGKSTSEEYIKKAKCIIDQYGSYKVKQINMTLNGINTQGENIADNGGVKEGYLALGLTKPFHLSQQQFENQLQVKYFQIIMPPIT